LEGKEDDDNRHRDTRVECSGKDVVILGPPREVTPSNNVLENETNTCPRNVVEGSRRRDKASSIEDDREIDVFQEAVGVPPVEGPRNGGCCRANQEEEDQRIIGLPMTEHEPRADDTPNDAGSSEDLGARADESVFLIRGAEVLDIGEHPGLDTQLDGTSNYCRDDLAPEHGSGRDLHVMAQFEVRGELQGLGHGDVTPGLEHHHRDRMSREGIANNELSNHVKPDLLVGDGLNHPDGNDIEEGNDKRQHERPHGHLSRPDFNTDNSENEHGQEQDQVPPFRDLRISRHKTGMDIGLFVKGPT